MIEEMSKDYAVEWKTNAVPELKFRIIEWFRGGTTGKHLVF